jgi:hypothetical protein
MTTLFLVLVASSLPAQYQYRFENSLSLSPGVYSANGLGTNGYIALRYNYFIFGGRFFVEGSYGIGSLKSNVLENVTGVQLYDHTRLATYEFLGAYDHTPSGYLPYFSFGVAGINEGGTSKFAGVLGIGKRIPLPGFLGSDRLGIRYDIRDHIFSQSFNNGESFISHNLVFTLGFQVYW